jgi:hypothetical protein
MRLAFVKRRTPNECVHPIADKAGVRMTLVILPSEWKCVNHSFRPDSRVGEADESDTLIHVPHTTGQLSPDYTEPCPSGKAA